MKNIFTQQNNSLRQPQTGATTTRKEENESLCSFFLNPAGANPARNFLKKSSALLRQAKSKIKQDSDFLGAPPEKNRPQIGITTTNEKTDACLHASALSAVRAKPASANRVAGFTLIETIVAMTILLVSISGIMNLIHQGSVANRQQADQITATYLASEAIEFFRARRDSHWLQSGNNTFYDWAVNSGDSQTCQYSCVIDARVVGVSEADKIKSCSGSCPPLRYNSGTQQYGYETGSGWEESRFTRSVTVELNNNVSSIDEAEITVTVSWQTAGSGDNSIILKESIYDYRGN